MNMSIRERARDLFEKTKGDVEAVRSGLLRWVRDNASVRREIHQRAEQAAVDEAVYELLAQVRSQAMRAPLPDRGAADAGISFAARAVVTHAVRGVWAFRLPVSGKAIGEATRAEVLEAARYYASMRTGYAERERWLKLIWQAAKDEKMPVRQQLSDADLVNLRSRAKKDAEAA
jgi:hypothetical protein